MDLSQIDKNMKLDTLSEVLSFEQIKENYEKNRSWGMSTSIDLRGCDLELINSKESIERYSVDLCNLIKMKRFGEPQVVYFGDEKKVEGYTLVQLIETSLISGHFTAYFGNAYIDVFSCSLYNPHDVATFTKEFFKGHDLALKVLVRG